MAIPLFPTFPGLEWPVKRTPIWSTIKQQSISGIDTRFQLWSFPRYRYEISFARLRSDTAFVEWQTLMAFYNSVGGAAQTFYFSDPLDSSVTNQGFGTGNGSNRAYQLVRSLGGFVEPVFAPASETILIGGVATGAFTLNNGLVTFNVAPGNGAPLTWTGTYVWPCRFDEDTLEFSEFAFNFWEVKKLTFTTLKL